MFFVVAVLMNALELDVHVLPMTDLLVETVPGFLWNTIIKQRIRRFDCLSRIKFSSK